MYGNSHIHTEIYWPSCFFSVCMFMGASPLSSETIPASYWLQMSQDWAQSVFNTAPHTPRHKACLTDVLHVVKLMKFIVRDCEAFLTSFSTDEQTKIQSDKHTVVVTIATSITCLRTTSPTS